YTGILGPVNFTFVVGSSTVLNPCTGFSATMTTTPSVTPNSGTATVIPFGGIPPYTFTWYNGNFNITSDSSVFLDFLSSGPIDCTVTSSNGCTFSVSGVIQGPNLNPCANFASSISTQNTNTLAPCNGSSFVVATGGTSPYSFVWNNGATSASVSSLCPGSYNCIITDANNCVSYDSTIIVFDTLVSINNTTFPNSSVIGNLGNINMTNCSINFAALSSATIAGATNGVNGNIFISWQIIDSNGVSSIFTIPYAISNSNPGVFAATLTITCYQKSQAIKTIVISDQVQLPGYSLGIEENTGNVVVTNPFDASLALQFDAAKTGSIQLVNLQGALVASKEFTNSLAVNIDTDKLTKGTYFVTINIDGQSIVRKLIK
ncbi:MAG: T9SS type A sorting domain-containing protein, partial [Crocinitomicaceae bacterium]|nr:T9SS type A sorting domain-containing protein [Crocinitomicaceae bacterium]